MRKKLLGVLLLLFLAIVSCGKNTDTEEQKKTEVLASNEEESSTVEKIAEESFIDMPEDINIDLSYYGVIQGQEPSSEDSISLVPENIEDVYVLNASCKDLDSLNKYAGAILESDIELSFININDGEHYLFISQNGEGQEVTVLYGESEDQFQLDKPEWYTPSSTDDAVKAINLVYHEAVGGNWIGYSK